MNKQKKWKKEIIIYSSYVLTDNLFSFIMPSLQVQIMGSRECIDRQYRKNKIITKLNWMFNVFLIKLLIANQIFEFSMKKKGFRKKVKEVVVERLFFCCIGSFIFLFSTWTCQILS
jgi:hypothetical protein